MDRRREGTGEAGVLGHLPCGTRRRPCRVILAHIPRRRVRVQRCFADDRHLKHAAINPRLQRFKRITRARIVWTLLFKLGHHPFGAIYRPGGEYSVIGFFDPFQKKSFLGRQ